MPFESLSFTHEFVISDFPAEWLPLTYLYDPDLPLFPIQYFHELDPSVPAGRRPGDRDRVFGFIHHINLNGEELTVSIVCNKDLKKNRNLKFQHTVLNVVRSRLGLGNPVALNDISGCLKGPLAPANQLIEELWYKVIKGSFGDSLPFGQMWDPVFGLARYVASFYSSGRKGELIQTHAFCSCFGERISMSDVAHADFYLLPTFEEFTDTSNPLNIFPAFSTLVSAVSNFTNSYSETKEIAGMKFSAFKLSKAGLGSRLNTEIILGANKIFKNDFEKALVDAYSSFDRGPYRSVFFYQLLNDLRKGFWSPRDLDLTQNRLLYGELQGAYQSPKVIQLYSQQCFGNETVLPIDNWVKTFLLRPFNFNVKKSKFGSEVFDHCEVWGKLERLVWVAAQARKVHSSVCADILWCVRYGAPNNPMMRGANPLSCKICERHIRDVCPGYKSIIKAKVYFNKKPLSPSKESFLVITSAGNNITSGQSIESVEGAGLIDVYSVRDRPSSYAEYPIPGHSGDPLSVSEFIEKY